jgi:ubiquinone/menaquinone biosynthesis C-methylase UbiE
VLDLGSGPGLDSLLAARRVGPTGKVVGVNLCPEMVEKARRNADLLGLRNGEFLHAGIEKLPLPDGSVVVVISNGVFNLCPDKPGVVADAFRVLRLGGRLLIADIRGTRQHQAQLAKTGMSDVTRRRLGWRFWWGGPWAATRLVTATNPTSTPQE